MLVSSLAMPGLLPGSSTAAYAAPGPDGQDPTACLNTVALANGGFERPVIPDRAIRQLPQEQVPGWYTTASDRLIELWSTGGVPASSGKQFAELNATQVSTLYQDVATTPGQTLYYSLDHRGRNGVDTMALDLGVPGAAPNFTRRISDGDTAWGRYTGAYTVPAGQTVTRLAFRAVSSAGGNPSIGNFLDNISFGTGACLVTTKNQTNLTRPTGPAQVGDIIEYTVTTTNQGGTPATNTVITDPVPANTAYLPNSLSVVSSPTTGQAGAKTDAVDSDIGSFGNGTVRFNVGDGANGTQGGALEPGGAVTTRFRTTILPSAAEQTITNQASVAFNDRDGSARTSTSGQVSTTVAPAADLAISKTSTPATQNAGSNVTYAVTVTNNGPSTATGVSFVDTLPAGVSYVSAAPPPGTSCSAAGQTVTCTLGTMLNGAQITVPITTTIAPDTTATQVNTARVSSTTSDYNTGNDIATAQTTVTTSADVSLTKTATPTTVAPGNQVTYTITARNNGPSLASNVRVTDVLPPGMSHVSATATGGTCVESSGTVTCTADSLSVGGTLTATIVARVGSSTPAGQLTNTARVSSTTADPNTANNLAESTVTAAPQADLQVTKTALTSPVIAGQQVRFSTTITNAGPSDATNVTLSDPTPSGLTFVGVTTSQGSCEPAVSCQIGTIAAGASVNVTTTYLVAADRQGAITNIATAGSETTDPNQANNRGSATITPVSRADLQITKVQRPAQFNYGDTVEYDLTVVNRGPSTARAVVLTDTLPEGITYLSATGPGCSVSNGTVTCAAGNLDPEQSVTVTIRVQTPPDGSGPLVNTARVSSDTTDPVPGNNTATYTASGGQQANLSIVKTTSGGGTLVAGRQVTYTLRVTNNGPSAAEGVSVRDELPAEVSFVSATPGGTCSAAGQVVTCTIGALDPGNDNARTITITGLVDPAYRGSSSNTATVTSVGPTDPTSSDNSSTSTSNVAGSADVFVTLTPNTQTVNAGELATFEMVVGNLGPSTAQDVVVTGQVPPGTSAIVGSSGGACTITDSTVTCTIGTLQPGQSAPPITFQALIEHDVPPGALVEVTAQVATSTPEIDPEDNTSIAQVLVVSEADLVLTKTVSPTPLVAGGPASFQILVSNKGPSDARNVVVNDEVPDGFSITSATIGGQPCSVEGQSVICTRAVISTTDVVRILIIGTVDADASGTLTNSALATSETPETNDEDNTGEVTAPITQSADLQVTKQAPQTVVAGSQIDYQLTVANTGPSDAAGVVLSDPLAETVRPTGVSDPACTITGQRIRCDFGTLPAGTSRTVLVQGVVDAAAEAGSTISNTATLTSATPGGGTREATATTTVTTSADVSIVKAAASTPVAGGLMRYTLTVTNNGPSVARDTVVTDATPAGALFIDAVPTSGSCDTADQGPDLRCLLGDVAPGQTITILVRYQLDARSYGQTLTNTAQVATTTPDPDAANNTSTATDTITDAARLTIDKQLTSGAVIAGGTASYRIVVGNNGPSIARGVRVSDVIPAPAEFVSATADGGGSCQASGTPTTLTCDWASVGVSAAEARTITLTVRIPVDTPDGTQLTNTATATSQTPADPVSDEATAIVGSSADVAVTKTLLTANPVAGAPAAWQVQVRNTGPSIARGVTVTDPAPTGVTITRGTPGAGSCQLDAEGALACQLGDLAPGGSVDIRVEGTIGADFTGTMTNSATATSSTQDPDPANNSGSASNEVGGSADLALTKRSDTPRVTAGGAIGWTVEVTNNGPSDATGVQITDAVPSEVTDATATIGATPCALTEGRFSCPVERIAAGATAVVRIAGTVNPASTAASIQNTAEVTASTPDSAPGNNQATVAVPLDTAADLALTKTGPQTAVAGTPIDWRLSIRNNGPSVARAVVLTDQIPAGIGAAEARFNGTPCPVDGAELRCAVGDLAPGASAEITVSGTIDQGRTEPVQNTATVTSNTPDPADADNTATSTTQVTSSADLAVQKVPDSGVFTAGQRVGWTLIVGNQGPSVATGVQLTDQLPAGVGNPTATLPDGTACPVENARISCPLGSLAAGEIRQIRITGTLAADYSGATVSNSAQVTGATPDPDGGDNTAEATTPVASSADLEVDKRIDGPVVAGAPITFEVRVTNNGPSLARAVQLTDSVPAQITDIGVDEPACAVTGQEVSCALGDLAVGADRTIRISGTVSQSFDDRFRNTATATSGTDDPNEQNNSAFADGTVGEAADLRVTKTGPAEVTAGAPVRWTIEVGNAGPSIARGVSVNDRLPAGLQDARVQLPDGQQCPDPTNCVLGDLAPGQTRTLTVTGTVAPDQPATTIANSVQVTSPTADPDGGNNDDTSIVAVTRNADLTIAKELSSGPLVPGSEAAYTITVRNAGPSSADGVAVADRLPDGLTVLGQPISSAGQCAVTDQLLSCDLDTLAPRASMTIRVAVQVAANLTGPVVNVASVSGITPDGDPGNNSATSTEPASPRADLTLTKTGPAAVAAGQPISWTITVDNAGPSFAQQVTVGDVLPAGLTDARVRTDRGECRVDPEGPSGTVSCDLGAVGVGDLARVTIVIDATVAAGYLDEDLVNTATLDSPTPEPGPGPDGRSDDATTLTTRSADLQVTKTHDPDASVIVGAPGPEGRASWSVLVRNAGPSTARNAVLTDTLPAGLTDIRFVTPPGVSCSQAGVCTLGVLAPGQTLELGVSGRLGADYGEPSVVNTVTLNSEDPDDQGSNNTSTDAIEVDRVADVQVTKTAVTQIQAGSTIEWELRIVNNGPSDVQQVILSDEIPEGLENPQFSAPESMNCTIILDVLSCRPAGPLAPGAANALTVRLSAEVPADRQAPIENLAQVFSSTLFGTPEIDSATATTAVTGSADLSVRKELDPEIVPDGTVTAGGPVGWIVTVRNDGPSVARAAHLTDVAPAAVKDLRLTSTQGSCTANRCELGDLAPGQTVTIQIRGTLDPDARGTLGNTAEVGSSTGDPDPGDNRVDTTPIPIGRSADLSLTKTADPSPAVPGAPLRYTLTVRNAGPSTAQSAQITDALPEGLQDPQVDDQRCAITSGVLGCQLGTVPVGAEVVITVTGGVAVDQQGELSNTASVSSPDPDPNPGNNSDQVGTPTAPANLSIAKTASAAQIDPGGELTWTLTVRNAGPGPARGAVVTDTLPAEVEVVSVVPSAGSCDPVEDQVLRCQPGGVPAEATVTITITARVADRALGALTNSATVSSPDDPDPGDNTGQVTTAISAAADLGIAKRVVAGGTVAGEPVSWELQVRNDGPDAALGVRLHDTLPAGVSGAALGPVPDGVRCAIDGNALDCTAAELASGASITVVVTATVAPDTRGELSNAASVTSDTRDPDPGDNTSTATVVVDGPPQPPDPGGPPDPGVPPGQPGPGQPGPGQPGPIPRWPLPNTGTDLGLGPLLLAAGMLPIGIGLLAVGRKRRRR